MKDKKTCGNPYTDLWAILKFTIEGSDYCKNIREENESPAFRQAICEKCVKKKCRFLHICIELYEMRKIDHKSSEEK